MNHLIAVYETVADAERVCDRLKGDKIPARDIRITRAPLAPEPAGGLGATRMRDPLGSTVPSEPNAAPERTGLTDELHRDELHEGGEHGWFYDWLRRSSMPEAERDAIITHMTGRRAAVTVDVETDEKRDRAVEIMEEGHPIDVEHDIVAATPPLGHQTAMRDETLRPGAAPPAAPTHPPRSGRTDRIEEGEQVFPVVKEDIAVGKRVREQRYRVRTYTVDKPIEEKVMLRDERVEIEHRPLTGAAAERATGMPKDREIEIVERHEEPVVEKRGTTAEEVVVRKEVVERPETVRGTARETKVEVEKEPMATENRVRRDLDEPAIGRPGIKPDRRP